MNIVISQSMYFPWIGLLEQVRLSDIFVHYDDVQYTRGFYNRVQIKTSRGPQWISIPLRDQHRGQHISEIIIDERTNWRKRHRELLRQSYLKAPFLNEMLALVDQVFDISPHTLSDLTRATMLALCEYFKIRPNIRYLDSNELHLPGKGSTRLLSIVQHLEGDTYITGHGARNYLNHQLFERAKISVKYMNYCCSAYPQLHGNFTPYVTALDLIANCGQEGRRVIHSDAVYWRSFINESD
jgi:hypothetical protein